MNFMKVKDGNQVFNLPVENGTISLSLVKAYFPEACCLTYMFNKEICAVDIIDGNIKVIDGMKEYDVFKTASKCNILNNAKKRRVEEIFAIMNKDIAKDDFNDDDKQIEKDELDPEFENFIKKLASRKVFVGWKHKDANKLAFLQMKELWGGVKTLELNKNHRYDYQEILKLGMQEVKNDRNSNILNNSTIELGNFQNDVFDNFNDFWKFSKTIKSNNRQIRIYILSTSKIFYENGNKENTVTTEQTKISMLFTEVKTKTEAEKSVISDQLQIPSKNCDKNVHSITSDTITQTNSDCLKLRQSCNVSYDNCGVKLSGSIDTHTVDKPHADCIQYYEDSATLVSKIKIVTNATSEYALNKNKSIDNRTTIAIEVKTPRT